MRINQITFNYDEIFISCTKSIGNKEKRWERIVKYKDIIDYNNKDFLDSYRTNNNFMAYYGSLNFESLSKDMIWLYDNKFSKKKSPGRKYYNQIRLSTPNERCPYCLLNDVNEVDHYIPKTVVPLLSITPQNLVPVCKDCNFQKAANKNLIPNPYFDNLDEETYLVCNIHFAKDILVFSYNINKPNNMINETFVKLNNLFQQIDILKSYNNRAQEKFQNDIEFIKLFRDDKVTYMKTIEALIDGRTAGFKKNTWEFAYYNSLKENYDSIVEYLK